jgi:hypothetical protein
MPCRIQRFDTCRSRWIAVDHNEVKLRRSHDSKTGSVALKASDFKQPVNQLEECGLARATAAEEHQHLSTWHLQVKTGKHLRPVDAIENITEFDGRSRRLTEYVRSSILEVARASKSS